MFDRRAIASLLLAATLLAPTTGCRMWRASFFDLARYAEIDPEAPFLKIHTTSGHVFVLDRWRVETAAKRIVGNGVHYNQHRDQVRPEGEQAVSFDDVRLLETNEPRTVIPVGVIVIGIVAGASLGVTAYCLADQKACFGSCPTFYVTGSGDEVPQAEGFSRSVARTVEATDVDALYDVEVPANRTLRLDMRNEALETHVVRSVRLLAVPRPEGGRVFRSGDAFVATGQPQGPRTCSAESGDCRAAVVASDGAEYTSPASGTDLAEQEIVELSFARPPGRLGLAIRARRSLLSTYVFYQALAYMGRSAAEMYMKIEDSPAGAESFGAVEDRLGVFDVEVLTTAGWVATGSYDEHGPIAREVEMLTLPDYLPPGEVRVRLRLTRGDWKIDFLGLASLHGPAQPMALPVLRAQKNGVESVAAVQRLHDPETHLITYPGDTYTLTFGIPAGDVELFLESRGYYYEWIRQQWLADENPEEVARLLFEPEDALRRLAPRYKRVETRMDDLFWSSRFRGTL